MVKYEKKLDKNNKLYIPKPVRETAGIETPKSLIMSPNAAAIAIYAKGLEPIRVIKSLEVIIHDLKVQAGIE